MFLIKSVDGIKGLYLTNKAEFREGDFLWALNGERISSPTQTSVKISDGLHIEDVLGKYLNHSCDPTVRIYNGVVTAVKNICSGDELTFDYTKNEDALVVPFTCKCCGKDIG